MSIGERIAQLRCDKQLSQGQLAELLGVTRQAVSKWENDLSSPDTIKLIKLADVLDTEVEYLANGRRTYGRRPPVIIKTTETVEKIVEKPVIQIREVVVEKVIERPVVEFVEKPVIRKVYHTRYVRNIAEFVAVGVICFLIGFLLGYFF